MKIKVGQNKVKKCREEYTWSIAELARRAGITSQTVSKMENNLPTNRNSQLKVAKALEKIHKEVFPFAK